MCHTCSCSYIFCPYRLNPLFPPSKHSHLGFFSRVSLPQPSSWRLTDPDRSHNFQTALAGWVGATSHGYTIFQNGDPFLLLLQICHNNYASCSLCRNGKNIVSVIVKSKFSLLHKNERYRKEIAQSSKRQQNDTNPLSLDCESGIRPLKYRYQYAQ